MNNQKGNQKTNIPLKEFNSTPIDSPTPASLSDNLEPSKGLVEESLTVEQTKPELIPESQVPPETQVEPLVESEVKDTLISEPEPEIKLESVTEPSSEPKIKLDQESEVIPLSEVGSQSNPNLELNPEVAIKPQPEPEVELKPVSDIEPKLDTEYDHEPLPTIQTETKLSSPASEDPEAVKQKIEEVLSYNSASSVVNSKSDNPKTSSFLKTIFTLSLIIFIIIALGLAYFILNPSLKTNPETKVVPTTAPVQSNITCELNGFIYTLNQSFPSADGCNTCTCVSADNIACTEKACTDVSTTPATKSATVTPIVPTNSLLNKITPTIINSENLD